MEKTADLAMIQKMNIDALYFFKITYLKRYVCVCIKAGRYNGLKRLQLEIVIFWYSLFRCIFIYMCSTVLLKETCINEKVKGLC